MSFIMQANPGAGYQAQRSAIDKAVQEVLNSGWYILGRQNKEFEKEFAAWLGAAHCIGVANGTDAVELALRGCGLQNGDLVFTVSHTAVATVAAIERGGAVPVLVDIEPDSFCMDPVDLRRALEQCRTDHPKARPFAVVPVHIYGHPAPLDQILEIASEYGLVTIEDCAQAHGALYNGQKAGTLGRGAAFSFYPTKNLGALGDGGAVVLQDQERAEHVRHLQQYGWVERYISSIPGLNSRLDELQAGILRARLTYLDADIARRREIAAMYSAGIRNAKVRCPQEAPNVRHAYHQYVIRIAGRESAAQRLREAGVGTAVHYPAPVHLQQAYQGRIPVSNGGRLPRTEEVCRDILSLPMYPELTDAQVQAVIAAINNL